MNDFRRSENPTKPTTSDMTVSEILVTFTKKHAVALGMNKAGEVSEAQSYMEYAQAEALAAIEAHYAAKENRAVKSKEREIRAKYGCPICRKPNQVAHKDCWKKAVADYTTRERLNNTEEVKA